MHTPLMDFNAARPLIVDEVVRRVTDAIKDPLLALNDTAYHEIRRLQHAGGDEFAEWRTLAGALGKMSDAERRRKLEELARRYAWDVAGNFDPRVYKVVSRAGVPVLGALLKPRHILKNLAHIGDLGALDGRILIQGPSAKIRGLQNLGTLVFVPTHLSNLDSVVFGFAIERAQLPPATYGAGKNLFTNPVLSFFMHNLGAYRVDRRLKHALYKDVLKTYSCVLIERGYHSLFFPGGTRSRSGGVERRLKLGLAGTGVEAFARTCERGRPQRVFFAPATINYLLTLEAETLIDDFLQEEGKSRYIIEDDESTRLARVFAFMQKLVKLEASVIIRFSEPVDCFGNHVDESGRSLDKHGRVIDAKSYLFDPKDRPVRAPARDAQYTRELGEVICAAFKRDTVAMSTHLVASVAFARLERAAGVADIFALLRHGDDVVVPRKELVAELEALLARAKEMASRGEIVLAPSLENASGDAILDEALRAFAGYHSTQVITPRGADLVLADARLLFYYQNRLAAHGLAADRIAPPPMPGTARSRKTSGFSAGVTRPEDPPAQA
jgi:glycerol-3-phosphate O-acyltransferase